LLAAPRWNGALVGRLAAAYDAELVPVDGPGAILDWCRERGLGLQPAVLNELLGPPPPRRLLRGAGVRVAAAVATVAALLAVGIAVTDDPGDRKLSGRAGNVPR
jgi:hypothetical protein